MSIMSNLPPVLLEWLKDNAWSNIVIGDDMVEEANGNLCRLFLSIEDAKALSILEVCNAFDVYIDIKKNQVMDNRLYNILLYMWHDEMSGSLCTSCISKSHLPAMPFACRINTNVPIEVIVAGFLNSIYLDGIPASELQAIESDQDVDVDMPSDAFVLPVYTIALP